MTSPDASGTQIILPIARPARRLHLESVQWSVIDGPDAGLQASSRLVIRQRTEERQVQASPHDHLGALVGGSPRMRELWGGGPAALSLAGQCAGAQR